MSFWRDYPFTEQEVALITELNKAHAASVHRDNISTMTVINTAAGSGSYTNAIAGAILTLGGIHAPLRDSKLILEADNSVKEAKKVLEWGLKVPGWGNSFVKDRADPLWDKVAEKIKEIDPSISEKIDSITNLLHTQGKKVYPNPSVYTAAAAIIMKVPDEIVEFLFISARLMEWTRVALSTLK